MHLRWCLTQHSQALHSAWMEETVSTGNKHRPLIPSGANGLRPSAVFHSELSSFMAVISLGPTLFFVWEGSPTKVDYRKNERLPLFQALKSGPRFTGLSLRPPSCMLVSDAVAARAFPKFEASNLSAATQRQAVSWRSAGGWACIQFGKPGA